MNLGHPDENKIMCLVCLYIGSVDLYHSTLTSEIYGSFHLNQFILKDDRNVDRGLWQHPLYTAVNYKRFNLFLLVCDKPSIFRTIISFNHQLTLPICHDYQ